MGGRRVPGERVSEARAMETRIVCGARELQRAEGTLAPPIAMIYRDALRAVSPPHQTRPSEPMGPGVTTAIAGPRRVSLLRPLGHPPAGPRHPCGLGGIVQPLQVYVNQGPQPLQHLGELLRCDL